MDRSLESHSWKRGFAAGFLVLAVSVGGQMATSERVRTGASCPIASRAADDLSERVMARISENIPRHAVAHRVALALIDAVLHGSNCS
jgi:hypothetical protein